MKYINWFYKNISYVLFLFFFSSLIGGLFESFYVFLLTSKFYIGGFMFGPLRPIYGFGCLLLYFITRNKIQNNVVVFIKCLLVLTVFEYLSSLILEIIFNRTWWDYSDDFLNLNGRISLFPSIAWGFLGIIYVKYLEPFLRKIFNSIKKNQMIIFLHGVTFYFLFDFVLSLIRNIN